jgi:hypothetical protein
MNYFKQMPGHPSRIIANHLATKLHHCTNKKQIHEKNG